MLFLCVSNSGIIKQRSIVFLRLPFLIQIGSQATTSPTRSGVEATILRHIILMMNGLRCSVLMFYSLTRTESFPKGNPENRFQLLSNAARHAPNELYHTSQ